MSDRTKLIILSILLVASIGLLFIARHTLGRLGQ
jgi:hypothetical protein